MGRGTNRDIYLMWIFSDFRKPRLSKNIWVVFVNRFDRLSRNFLSTVPSLFAKTYPNYMTLSLKKNRKLFGQIDKLIVAEKN